MVKVSAPGKLMLAGEWAVLEGNHAIVTAVNKRVFAEVGKSPGVYIVISVEDFGIKNVKASFDGKKINWINTISEEWDKKLLFLKAALEAVLQYLGSSKPFKINSWGEMSQIRLGTGELKKIGFGSSAASVVAAIAGVMAFNGHDISERKNRDLVYKLSAIAHYYAQGKMGSAFDIAASTYGGVFAYRMFDPAWLVGMIEKSGIRKIAEDVWKDLFVEPLNVPEDFDLIIGWTKESASTTAMIGQMKKFKEDRKEDYNKIYSNIGRLVQEIIKSWRNGDRKKILELIRKNEDYLRELGKKSGVNIETFDLKKLSELANRCGAAGKLSGAGGGDCGIAVSFDGLISERVKNEWEQAGLYVVDAKIDLDGVRVEK